MRLTPTDLELAAADLISAIQREWSAEAGGPCAAASEDVMHSAHRLLQAAREGSINPLIGSGSVSQYLGRAWINAHPWVWPHVQVLESLSLREC